MMAIRVHDEDIQFQLDSWTKLELVMRKAGLEKSRDQYARALKRHAAELTALREAACGLKDVVAYAVNMIQEHDEAFAAEHGGYSRDSAEFTNALDVVLECGLSALANPHIAALKDSPDES